MPDFTSPLSPRRPSALWPAAHLIALLALGPFGAAAIAQSPAPSRPLEAELPLFLNFIERPKLLAQRASDRLLALKCDALAASARRRDELLSQESGAPRSLSELALAEGVALCLLRGSPEPAPAAVRASMEAVKINFSANALADFPALSPRQRADALRPFASTLAPSIGVASDEGRRSARNAILRWQRLAVAAGDSPAIARSFPLAFSLHQSALAAARAERWRLFQAETELPVGLRLALQSPSFRGEPAPDPHRPLSSKTRSLLNELWAFHWSASRPLDESQRSSSAPNRIPLDRGEFFEAERSRYAAARASEPTAFAIRPSDQALAETPAAWSKAFSERAKPAASDEASPSTPRPAG